MAGLMSLEFVIRLVGMVVVAVLAFQVALSLGGTWKDVRVISALTLAGAALGLMLAPWLTIRPVRWVSNRINNMSSSQLFAGVVGLILGLAIAALMTPALSNLPPPFGEVVPFAVSMLFGYLGMAMLMRRHREVFAFVNARLARDGGATVVRRRATWELSYWTPA